MIEPFGCALVYSFCSIALCPNPIGIDNGEVTFTGNSVRDTATYTCNLGFELIGDATTTCTQVDVNSAEFQPMLPFCSRECTAYNKTVKLLRMATFKQHSLCLHSPIVAMADP